MHTLGQIDNFFLELTKYKKWGVFLNGVYFWIILHI